MRVLVTGGAGFIGSHLAADLVGRGDTVRIFDAAAADPRGNLAAIGSHVEFLHGDLRDDAAVGRAVEGIEVVYHMAADASVPRSVADPRTCYDVNVTGTLNLLEAARKAGCRRVVFASSSAVYGDDPVLPKRESMPPRPGSPYASSKLAGEDLCAVFWRSYGLESVALRFFNVYGPRQDPNGAYAPVIPRFIAALRRGETPTVFGDGEQTRDFVYVADVVRALRLGAATPDAAGGVFNVASGQAVTLSRLVALLFDALGAEVRIRHEPERPGDVRHSAADTSAIRAALGWEADVSLDAGLSQTIASEPGE